MTQQYKVAEFAKLAGVTVRTLQYYDRLGLLSPSATTEAGYRLYTTADLLPLQQIVTLKWMGFSLKQIKQMLSSPRFDLKQMLLTQKTAVHNQIEQLQAAAAALDKAMELTDQQNAPELETAVIQTIIRAVTKQGEFMDSYYSDTAQAGIALRNLAYTPSEMAGFQQQWQSLYARFEALIDRPLNDPAVRELAAEMDTLIHRFTGGDEATETGLRRIVNDATAGKLSESPQAHAHFTTVDNDLQSFMQRALEHYRKE